MNRPHFWDEEVGRLLNLEQNLEGPTRKPRHASASGTRSDMQAVSFAVCERLEAFCGLPHKQKVGVKTCFKKVKLERIGDNSGREFWA